MDVISLIVQKLKLMKSYSVILPATKTLIYEKDECCDEEEIKLYELKS